MAGELEFEPPDMQALGKKLRAAGRKDLNSALTKRINTSVKPARQAFKKSALSRLPRRGGLNVRVAKTKYRTAKKKNGVRLVATGQDELDLLDSGTVRHPTFGHKPWVAQSVRPGVFSDPWKALAPSIRAEVGKAIDDTIKEIRD